MDKPAYILVVDDEEAETIAAFLREHGYRVETAKDGREGWERIQQEKPALLITADVFPDFVSGYDLVRWVRETDSEMLTALLHEEPLNYRAIRGYTGFGPDLSMSKPFHPPELLKFIRRLLGE